MFKKLNIEGIEIKTVPDTAEARDFEPSFWWDGKRYYLNDFIRVHNNPWLGACEDIPEYIHGVQSNAYYKPLYIELVGSDYVNVYEKGN